MKNKRGIILLILILIIIIICLVYKNKLLKIIYPQKYKQFVNVYSEEYDVEKNLVYAVIKAESNFDEQAVSHKDAIGLMQIMEDTAVEIANKYNIQIDENNPKEDISNTQKNINIGTKYLSILLNKYQNKEVALAAYNAGIGTVDKWIESGIINSDGSDIENIPYKETNNYVRKIIGNYKIYNELYK